MNLIRYFESEYYSENNPLQRFSLTLGELIEERILFRIFHNGSLAVDIDLLQTPAALRLEILKFMMALTSKACDTIDQHDRIFHLLQNGAYHQHTIEAHVVGGLKELFKIGDGGFSLDNRHRFIEFYDMHKNNPMIINKLKEYVAFANDLHRYPTRYYDSSDVFAYDPLTAGLISSIRYDLPNYLYRYSNQLSLDKFCRVIKNQLNQQNLPEKTILDIVALIKYSGLELSKDYIQNAYFILSHFKGNSLERFVAGINRSITHEPHKYGIDVSPYNRPKYLSLELKKILRDPRNIRLDFHKAYSAIGLNVLLRQQDMIGENDHLPSEIVGRLANKNIYHSRNIRYIKAILPDDGNEHRGEYFKLIYSILQDHQLRNEPEFIQTLLAINTHIQTTGVRITEINDEDLKQIKKLIKGKEVLVDDRITKSALDEVVSNEEMQYLTNDTMEGYYRICKSSKINPYAIPKTITGILLKFLNSFPTMSTLENLGALKDLRRLAFIYQLGYKFGLDHEALIHFTKMISENNRYAQLDKLWSKLSRLNHTSNSFTNSFMKYFVSSKRDIHQDITTLRHLFFPSRSEFYLLCDFIKEIFEHINAKNSISVKAIINFTQELNLLDIKNVRYLSQLIATASSINNHSDVATTIDWLKNNFVIDATLISAPTEFATLSFMKRSILHAVASNLDHRDYLARHYAGYANMADRLNAERSSGEANIIRDADSSIRNTLKKYLSKYSPSKYLIGNNSGSSQTTNRAIDNSINRRSRV
jgi:hypothetical protein